ncbi:MAG: tetratricopeptide repeat protein [Pseudomonadota bacterium]|nr:tetratricopeptide repeat protein [Pseudomonadota bacterium]
MTLAVQGMAISAVETDNSGGGTLAATFQLYEAGRFDEAAVRLRPHGEQGNARAQLYLATLYRTGAGVEADECEAANWYERAARQGVAEAQFHLGLMYLEGVGVTENSDEALEWISRAAEQGFGDALDVFNYMLNHDEVLAC